MKPFEGIMGNNVELRMIEFLLPFHGVEFNITDLAKEAGVSRTTADRVVKKFVDWNFMKISRTRAQINYYSVNERSPLYRAFIRLDNTILEQMLSDEELFEIHDEMERRELIGNRPTPLRPAPASIPNLYDGMDWTSYLPVAMASDTIPCEPVSADPSGSIWGPNTRTPDGEPRGTSVTGIRQGFSTAYREPGRGEGNAAN